MAQLRSVNTKFWEDPWVENLTPNERYLFLYLLTCGNANIAGVYEITIKRISFETGLDVEIIRKAFERFTNDKKAYFVNDNYIFLPNWLKNQNINTNMKVGVLKIFHALPISVLITILGNDYQSVLKDYQTLSNVLLNINIEVLEYKYRSIEEVAEIPPPHTPIFEEPEKSKRKQFKPPTIDEVQNYCIERKNNVDADRFVNFYASKNWMVGKNKMKDWKAAVRTWEKNSFGTPQPQQSILTPEQLRDMNFRNQRRKIEGKELFTPESYFKVFKGANTKGMDDNGMVW